MDDQDLTGRARTDRVPSRAAVRSADGDARVCVASRGEMLSIQRESERAEWATRWSTSQAMLEQVAPHPIYICPILRERRNAEGDATRYRCLALYRRAEKPGTGAVVTVDIAADILLALPSLPLAPDVSAAFYDIFALAANGIELSPKD